MRIGRILARLCIGGVFFAHGVQKLFGWFDGPGLEGASQMMESLELSPGRRNAVLASGSEAVGGAMLAAGALTPVAAAALIGTMITAIRKVHFQKGFFNSQGGYEFNLTLIAALLAIVDSGPGELSVDRALRIERSGGLWALAALGGGAAGSAIAVRLGESEAHRVTEGERSSSQPEAAERPQPAPAVA